MVERPVGIRVANYYLFGIQMVANSMFWTIWLATMVKSNQINYVIKFFTFWIANHKFAIKQDMAWIAGQSMNGLFWTIRLPNKFPIQIPTVVN